VLVRVRRRADDPYRNLSARRSDRAVHLLQRLDVHGAAYASADGAMPSSKQPIVSAEVREAAHALQNETTKLRRLCGASQGTDPILALVEHGGAQV